MTSFVLNPKTTAICLGLTAALLTAGCNGKRTYSLGSGGGFGADGATGPAGPAGEPGPAGPAGSIGPAGPAGPAGPSGPQGSAGLNGLDGLLGGDGEDGLAGGLTNGLEQVTIGDRTILGQAGDEPGPLGVGVLSPTVPPGEVATVGVLSGGQVATVAVGQPNAPVAAPTGPANGLLGVTLAGQQILGSSEGAPAVDLNVLSPGGASGTAVTGNVLSNGQPVAVGLAQPATAGQGADPLGAVTGVVGGVLGGGAGAGNPLGTVTGVVGGVLPSTGGGGNPLGAITGVVGGVLPGVLPSQSGEGAGGLVGGLLGGRKK